MEDEGTPQIEAGSGIDPVDQSPNGAHKPEEIVAKLRQVDVLVSALLHKSHEGFIS